jgi:PAS domain S-box-containing protein
MSDAVTNQEPATAGKPAKEELHRIQRLLNATQRLTRVGGWEWHIDTGEMTWTEETYRIHGLVPDQRPTISAELIEFSLSCYSPEGREIIKEAFTRCVEAGLPYDLRIPFVASNGSRLWVRTMAEAVRDKTGRIVAVQGNIIDVTDQVNQEDHLRIFKNIVSSTSDAIACLDSDYRYRVVNSAYNRYAGGTPYRCIGLTIAEYLGEDVFTTLIKPHFDRCLQGEIVSYQEWFDYPVVGRRCVEISYSPYRDDSNRIIGVIANTRDITSRKKGEELLRARLRISEAAAASSLSNLLRSMLDEAERLTESRIGFFHFLSEDQRTLSPQIWSTATLGHYCWARGEGRHYPLEKAGVWADCIRQRRPVIHNDFPSLECRGTMPEGHLPLQREMVIPIFREGKIVGVFGLGNKERDYSAEDSEMITSFGEMAWDVILRKQAEEQLQLNEQRLQLIFDHSPLGMATVAKTLRFLTANSRFCGLVGYSEEELRQRTFAEITCAEDRTKDIAEVKRLLAGKIDKYETEKRYIRKDGRTIWAKVNVALIRDLQQAPLFFLPIIEDISDRRQAEDQLKASLQEREILLREVHHRVKNNLAAIVGLLDMQRRLLGDREGQGILAELSGRIRSMALIHEKLYRAENLARINFDDYLKALTSHLQTSFGSPGLFCQAEAKGVEMPLDLAVPCGMIVNELVTNSMKYAFPTGRPATGEGDCRISIEVSAGAGTYRLSVADNGVGLPPGFDWRKAETLGMLLVRMLGSHQLGGSFQVEQEKGLRFTLRFSELRSKKPPIEMAPLPE